MSNYMEQTWGEVRVMVEELKDRFESHTTQVREDNQTTRKEFNDRFDKLEANLKLDYATKDSVEAVKTYLNLRITGLKDKLSAVNIKTNKSSDATTDWFNWIVRLILSVLVIALIGLVLSKGNVSFN